MDGHMVSNFLTCLHLFNIFWTYKYPIMSDLWHVHKRHVTLLMLMVSSTCS